MKKVKEMMQTYKGMNTKIEKKKLGKLSHILISITCKMLPLFLF